MIVSHVRILLSICMLSSVVICIANHDRLEIDSPFLKVVDNNPDGINIPRVLRLIQNLENLLHGDKKANKPGLVTFSNEKLNVLQLVEREEKSHNRAEFKPSLKETINLVIQFSGDALEKLRKNKPIMLSIIKKWCEQRKRPHSLLLPWASKTEQQLIDEDITSFKSLSNFIQDLSCLLRDVLYTCKKSMARYAQRKEEYLKEHPHQP